MKALPWILVGLLTGVFIWMWYRPVESHPAEIKTETKIKTIVKVDTLFISSPMAPLRFIQLKDTIRIGDTVVHREQALYADSLYKAWVSGYRPKLDSIEVYPQTIYQTLTNDVYHTIVPKKKRWGLSLQAGYGYPSGIYIGIGCSYNLFQW